MAASNTASSNINSYWTAPSVGEQVELHSLKAAPYLNGSIGFVASTLLENGRYKISMQSPWVDPKTKQLKQHQLSLKPANLRPIGVLGTDGSKKWHLMLCNGCGNRFDRNTLKKCQGCRYTNYCSKECQTNHWNHPDHPHKDDCKILREARDGLQSGSKGDRCWAKLMEGGRLLQKGKGPQAERHFRSLLEDEGFFTIATFNNIGTALLIQGKMDEALAYYRIATMTPKVMGREDDLALAEAFVQLGVLLQNYKRDNDGAKRAYQEALKSNPEHTEARGLLQSLLG